jgi:hypothetical protein
MSRAEINFAALPDPVATARGSDTPCLNAWATEKVIQIIIPPRYQLPRIDTSSTIEI